MRSEQPLPSLQLVPLKPLPTPLYESPETRACINLGGGGTVTSTTPSSIFTTVPIAGLISSLSCMHHIATVAILVASSLLYSPLSLASTTKSTFPCMISRAAHGGKNLPKIKTFTQCFNNCFNHSRSVYIPFLGFFLIFLSSWCIANYISSTTNKLQQCHSEAIHISFSRDR